MAFSSFLIILRKINTKNVCITKKKYIFVKKNIIYNKQEKFKYQYVK